MIVQLTKEEALYLIEKVGEDEDYAIFRNRDTSFFRSLLITLFLATVGGEEESEKLEENNERR